GTTGKRRVPRKRLSKNQSVRKQVNQVKRQFINPQSGKGYQPEQIPLSAERSSADARSVITSEQPLRESPPPTFIPHRPITNGQVSNWNMNELTSLPFVWNPAAVSLADQETIEQEVIQQPNGNGYPQGNPAWGAGNEFGQVSPHQSAIAPLAAVYSDSQPFGSSQSAMPRRGPVSDTMLPINRYNSQTLPPPQRSEAERVSILPPWSGQFSPSMPPVPKQGQGGGLPPFIHPPSGE